MPHNPSYFTRPTGISVSFFSPECSCSKFFMSVSPTSAAYQVANAAMYLPIVLQQGTTFTNAFVYTGTANGNFDIGIYNADTLAKIYSTGSTAGVNTTLQQISCSVTLGPGKYLWAFAADSATATYGACQRSNIALRMMGVLTQDSAFALPNTATPVAANSTFTRVYTFGFSQGTI